MNTQDAWHTIAEHYKKLSTERASEGPGVQLACLVLAEHCVHLWTGSGGGPSRAMVALAERVVGDRVDDVVDRERELAEKTKLGKIGRPRSWNGMCPAAKHGLDFEGQRCDLCSSTEAQT